MMLKKYKNTILTITIVVGTMISTLPTIIILNSLIINSIPTYESSLQWITPTNHSSIIFGTGNAEFEFKYSYNSKFINQVKLFMNDIFISDVTDKNEVQLNYNESLDGEVNATLKGYAKGEEIESDSIKLHFSKLIEDKIEKYDSGMVDLGPKLLLIVHDPNGSDCYSVFFSKFEGMKYFMGIDSDAIVKTVFNLKDYYNPYLFIFENGSTLGYDCLYTLNDSHTISLSSSQLNNELDMMGPGKGDAYLGELWELNWSFMGRKQVYFNGTIYYIDPYLLYEINSTTTMIENSIYALKEWKDLNPVLNGYPEDEVEWTGVDDLVNASNIISSNVNITISYSTSALFGLSDTNLGFILHTRNHNVHVDSYWGDSSDIIKNRAGIDKNFGTVIFQYDGS